MAKTTIAARGADRDMVTRFMALEVNQEEKLGDALARAMKRTLEKQGQKDQLL